MPDLDANVADCLRRFHALKDRAAEAALEFKTAMSGLDDLKKEMERLLAFDESLSLAHAERTGKLLGPGEEYTPEDWERAVQILGQCWDRNAEA